MGIFLKKISILHYIVLNIVSFSKIITSKKVFSWRNEIGTLLLDWTVRRHANLYSVTQARNLLRATHTTKTPPYRIEWIYWY